ncbi:MAG: toxin, partial [Bacteroidetes bacterium]|nr:toxin [Bacteroidota bacterium]
MVSPDHNQSTFSSHNFSRQNNDGNAESRNSFEAPSISLPKGGGAMKGIDEKFIVNAVNGTNSLAVPLPISPARAGFSPGLSLGYSSGLGNSAFGLGWTVGIPTIKRKTEKELPKYQDAIDSDTFILSDAEDLVPFLDNEQNIVVRESETHIIKQFRPRIEGLWARIEQWKNKQNGEIFWRTISPDNITSYYGIDSQSRIANPSEPGQNIYEWMLCHSYDDKGNIIIYQYKAEDFVGIPNLSHEKNRNASNCTNQYLKRVLYGNKTHYHAGQHLPSASDFMFETVFDYGEHDNDNPLPEVSGNWDTRPDSFSFFRAGFDIRTYR